MSEFKPSLEAPRYEATPLDDGARFDLRLAREDLIPEAEVRARAVATASAMAHEQSTSTVEAPLTSAGEIGRVGALLMTMRKDRLDLAV